MTGKFKLLPKNFEYVIAGTAAVVVDLDDRGEVVIGSWLLDDLDLLAAAFFAGNANCYGLVGKRGGEAECAVRFVRTFNGLLLERVAFDGEMDFVIDASSPEDFA